MINKNLFYILINFAYGYNIKFSTFTAVYAKIFNNVPNKVYFFKQLKYK